MNAKSAPASWRENKWLAIAELAIVVSIFVADWLHLGKYPGLH